MPTSLTATSMPALPDALHSHSSTQKAQKENDCSPSMAKDEEDWSDSNEDWGDEDDSHRCEKDFNQSIATSSNGDSNNGVISSPSQSPPKTSLTKATTASLASKSASKSGPLKLGTKDQGSVNAYNSSSIISTIALGSSSGMNIMSPAPVGNKSSNDNTFKQSSSANIPASTDAEGWGDVGDWSTDFSPPKPPIATSTKHGTKVAAAAVSPSTEGWDDWGDADGKLIA